MKRAILLLAVALGLALPARATFLDVNVFGGYTTLCLADFNDSWDKTAYRTHGSATPVKSGWVVGADAGLGLLPLVKIGPRVEYLQAAEGKVESAFITQAFNARLLLLELGVSTDWSLPLGGLSVSAGAWGGYGMAGGTLKSATGPMLGPVVEETVNVSGNCWSAELAARLKYAIFGPFSAGLDLGYRFAKVAEMKADKTSAIYDPGQGRPMYTQDKPVTKADNLDPLAFDFSGLNAGLALNLNF